MLFIYYANNIEYKLYTLYDFLQYYNPFMKAKEKYKNSGIHKFSGFNFLLQPLYFILYTLSFILCPLAFIL